MVAEMGFGAGQPRTPAQSEAERERWACVRADAEDDRLTESQICRKHKVTADEYRMRMRREGWRVDHREPELELAMLIRRLFVVVERHIERLEVVDMSETGEKEATVLSKIVATMDKLIEIRRQSAARRGRHETREMQDLRNQMARRIDRLKRGE